MDFLFLPRYHFINNLPLFGGCATQVDACRLDAFMPHQVRKQGYVIELVKEVLGEAMTKRVWINHFTIKTILVCKML